MKSDTWIGKKGFRYWYYHYRDSDYYSLSMMSGIIIVCLLLLFNVILPELNNWFSIRNEVIATRAQIAILQQNISFISSLDKSTLDSQLQTATHALPPTKDFAGMLNAISNSAAVSGVSLDDYSFVVGDIASSSGQFSGISSNGLSSTQVTVVVGGSIDKIRRFIKSLESNLPLSEVTLINGNEGNISITISFYQKPIPNVNYSGDTPIEPISADNVTLLHTLSSWDNSANLQNGNSSSGSNSAIPLF